MEYCQHCGQVIKKVKNPKVTNPDVTAFVKLYFDKYGSVFHQDPPFAGGRDGVIIKRLLKRHNLATLNEELDKYLTQQDQFIKNNAYDLPRFERYIYAIVVGGYDRKPNKEEIEAQEAWCKAVSERANYLSTGKKSFTNPKTIKVIQSIGFNNFMTLSDDELHGRFLNLYIGDKKQVVDRKMISAGGEND